MAQDWVMEEALAAVSAMGGDSELPVRTQSGSSLVAEVLEYSLEEILLIEASKSPQ